MTDCSQGWLWGSSWILLSHFTDLPLNNLGLNHKLDVFKNINEKTDTMCINKSTASGLPVQGTSSAF